MRSLAIGALIIAARLQAQSVITGVVRDLENRPVADVEVMVVSPEQRVRTDSAGKFRLSGLAAGKYSLRSRRIGYFAVGMTLTLAKNDTVAIVVDLQKRPVMLDTVQITASCPRWEFVGFACRRRNGAKGEFLDVDAIDSTNPRFIADLFRRPGFRVEAAARGGLRIVPLTGWRCMTVIVNGRPVSPSNPAPQTPKDLLGVEIYADQADVPSEYNGYAWGKIKAGRKNLDARCTLVVYWTSIKPRRK